MVIDEPTLLFAPPPAVPVRSLVMEKTPLAALQRVAFGDRRMPITPRSSDPLVQ
jgi:hypothetical protein